MKAAVLKEINHPLIIEDIEIPPLLRGQVLVKIAYSGVCHSQLMEVRGGRGHDQYLPHLLGHEASGKVVATGTGITKVKKGDLVILSWIKGIGLDVPGTQYKKDGALINAGAVTTFNEYAVVSENRCFKLPDGIPLDIAVLFGCALPTGAGIVINSIKPDEGDSIAVFGLGGIGLSALMAVMLFDCYPVIAVDVNDEKLQLAKEFGATHLINSSNEDPLKKIFDITDGTGLDYSIEAAGQIQTIETAFQAVKKGGGKSVFASHPKHDEKIHILPHDLISGKRIEGSWGGETKPDTDIPLLAELFKKGHLPLEKMITKKYKLNEINHALDDLEKMNIIRAVIEINPKLK